MSWQMARAVCENLGGHLVTITSEAEQLVVQQIPECGSKKQYWLGLDLSEKQWVTGESISYTKWGSGQPDGFVRNNGDTESYAQIYNKLDSWNNTNRFEWNDCFDNNLIKDKCTFFDLPHIGFICEIMVE